MTLLNYQDFLFETFAKVKISSAKENLLRSISNNYLNEEEKISLNYLIAEGFSNDIISLCESDDEFLYENLIDKFKEKFQKAQEYIKDKGKAAMDKLSDATKKVIQFGGNILKAVQSVLVKIGKLLKDLWEEAKAAGQAAVDKSKEQVLEMAKKLYKKGDKKVSLKDETSHTGEMIAAGTKFITGGLVNDLASAAKTAASSDDKNESTYISYLHYGIINEISLDINRGISIDEIVESLNEGGGHGESGGINIPYVSDLMDGIGHMPPFKYFHKIGENAAEFSNNALSKASYTIHKIANGPTPYKFVALGTIFGVALSYFTEDFAKQGIFHFLHFVPYYKTIKWLIKVIGLSLAIYGLLKTVVGQEGEEEKHKEKTEETK
jgi:hypothetical protein